MIKHIILVQFILLLLIPNSIKAQDNIYSLEQCINYAWENSTEVGRAVNGVDIQSEYLSQSKAARGPNLFFTGKQSISSTNNYSNDASPEYWSRNTNNSLSVSLSSEITLYNGAKIKNTITQNKTNLAAAESDIQVQKESISLNILSAYINVLLSTENVKNYESQLESTQKQLALAEARKTAGMISVSDYLNIKSQYASDKATLVNAKNTKRLNLVVLMQLMNMPISDSFKIEEPKINTLLEEITETDASIVYTKALDLQPIINSAELNLQSVEMNEKIAKADALPQLSLGGSIGTAHSSLMQNVNFGEQFSNQIVPYLGLTLYVPIYQRKKVKTNVEIAKIQIKNENLNLVDLKNDLRKYIEQACIDYQTANSNYLALIEQYDAENESYLLSNEMFTQGLLNSVDLLSSKNNLITAENKLTQAKYSVLLQKKIIDYYIGKTILF